MWLSPHADLRASPSTRLRLVPSPGNPGEEDSGLELEVALHRSPEGSGELDEQVGGAVAVGVARDEPVVAVLIGAKLSGRAGAGAAEGVGTDPGEGLVAADEGVGV